MAKDHIYIFTKNNVRSLTGNFSSGLSDRAPPSILLNPDITLVKGVERQYWKLEDGKIVPMSQEERNERRQHIDEYGVDNKIPDIHSFIKTDHLEELVARDEVKAAIAVKVDPPQKVPSKADSLRRNLIIAASVLAGAIVAYLLFK